MRFAIGFSVTSDESNMPAYLSALISMSDQFKNACAVETEDYDYCEGLFENEHTIQIFDTIDKLTFLRMLDYFWPTATCNTMGMLGHPENWIGLMPAVNLECEDNEAIISFYVCPLPDGEPREPIKGWCQRYYDRAIKVLDTWCDRADFYRILQNYELRGGANRS